MSNDGRHELTPLRKMHDMSNDYTQLKVMSHIPCVFTELLELVNICGVYKTSTSQLC